MCIRYVRSNVPDCSPKLNDNKERGKYCRLQLESRRESEKHGRDIYHCRDGLAPVLDDGGKLPHWPNDEERGREDKDVAKGVHLAELCGDQEEHCREAQEGEARAQEDHCHDNTLCEAQFEGPKHLLVPGSVRVGLLRGLREEPCDLALDIFKSVCEIEHFFFCVCVCLFCSVVFYAFSDQKKNN